MRGWLPLFSMIGSSWWPAKSLPEGGVPRTQILHAPASAQGPGPEDGRSFTDHAWSGVARHLLGGSIASRGTPRPTLARKSMDRRLNDMASRSTCPMGRPRLRVSARKMAGRSRITHGREWHDTALDAASHHEEAIGLLQARRAADRCPEEARHETTLVMCRPPLRGFASRMRNLGRPVVRWTASFGAARHGVGMHGDPRVQPTAPRKGKSEAWSWVVRSAIGSLKAAV